MFIEGVALQVDLAADGGLHVLVVVLAHLQGGCGRQGAGPRRGGGGRRRCALLEWRQGPWAVGGPRQAVRRAGSEWPAGAGDEQSLLFKHC